MTEYARIEDGQIVEYRHLDTIPPHKAFFWKQVSREGSGDVLETIIEESLVRIVRSERPIAEIKAELKTRLKSDAERVRSKYRTAGKDMVYLEKRDQANAVHQMGEVSANALTEAERTEQFPTLAASVGLEAATLWDCSQLVISKAEQWADLSYVIERTELAGSKAISDASDAAAARAAYEAIAWTV